MKVLVFGGQGMLGSDLVPIIGQHHEVIAPAIDEFDITNREMVRDKIMASPPSVVVNCAAYTLVDKAEEEREQAFAVNAFAAQNLALACAESGTALCHVSTDYVFDGTRRMSTPYDCTGPLNVYGMSKLAGERMIQWAMSRFYIIRTSWLYGWHGRNFVEAILERAAGPDDLRVVYDQVGAPTWSVSLSNAIARLIETDAYGIYHFTDDACDGVSWYDFAVEILAQAGMAKNVKPVTTPEFPRPARRPANSMLDCTLIEMLGIRRDDWKHSLKRYIEGRKN